MSNLEITCSEADFDQASSSSVRLRIKRLLKKGLCRFAAWRESYDRRQRLINLLSYDDHMLDDMGYTRADLEQVAKLPLHTDAHQILRQLSEQRRKNYWSV